MIKLHCRPGNWPVSAQRPNCTTAPFPRQQKARRQRQPLVEAGGAQQQAALGRQNAFRGEWDAKVIGYRDVDVIVAIWKSLQPFAQPQPTPAALARAGLSAAAPSSSLTSMFKFTCRWQLPAPHRIPGDREAPEAPAIHNFWQRRSKAAGRDFRAFAQIEEGRMSAGLSVARRSPEVANDAAGLRSSPRSANRPCRHRIALEFDLALGKRSPARRGTTRLASRLRAQAALSQPAHRKPTSAHPGVRFAGAPSPEAG